MYKSKALIKIYCHLMIVSFSVSPSYLMIYICHLVVKNCQCFIKL